MVGGARMHRLTNEERRILTASAESYYVHERFFRHLSVSEYSICDAASYDYGTEPLQRLLPAAAVNLLERSRGDYAVAGNAGTPQTDATDLLLPSGRSSAEAR